MKYLTISLVLSELKINNSLARAKTETAKTNLRKLYPAVPLAYTNTNRSGDKSQVDNWTRPIKGTKKEIKREKGYIFYEIILEVPSYLNANTKSFENDFEKFVRDYITKNNSHMGLMFISFKFSGYINPAKAIKDSITEKKENYIDNSLDQIKEQANDYQEFYKKHKILILGGAGTVLIFVLVVAVKR